MSAIDVALIANPVAWIDDIGCHTGRDMIGLASHRPILSCSLDQVRGLPEHWRSDHRTGTFDTGGAIPSIDDPRVQFVKGWFDQTLPAQKFPEHDRLVLNIDCDLYSSTATVLKELRPLIVKGTYIYFDELDDYEHEQLAFDEFLDNTDMEFKLIGATPGFTNTAFQRVT